MSGENCAYRVDRDANVQIRTRECTLRDRGGGDDAELKLLRVLWMVAVMMLIAAGQGIAEDEMQPKLAFVRDLQQALRTDDRGWIADHLHYPVRYNGRVATSYATTPA